VFTLTGTFGVRERTVHRTAEALTNAAKHARASTAPVDVALRDSRLEISVADNGVAGADPASGSGLVGLIDRINAMGGRIAITSLRGEGTQMRVQLPVNS
jgi:signal transduction histidine kinase